MPPLLRCARSDQQLLPLLVELLVLVLLWELQPLLYLLRYQ